VKVNSLADAPIIDKLYEASCAGVPVRMVVRGICCLVPGVEGQSENIRVVSVIGRYLEHHRIYRFCNDGEDQVYLSSADWMPRNLNRRVETCFPIDAKPLKERVFRLLDTAMQDNTHAWELHGDGSWTRVPRGDGPEVDFQEYCAREATLYE